MSVSYIGTTVWCECEHEQITQDPWGTDVLTRTFNGRSDQLQDFVDSYKRNRALPDADYPLCTLSGITVQPAPGVSRATLTFKGIASENNQLPSPTFTGGTRARSVSIPYIGDTLGTATGVIATFEYYAPFATRVEYIRTGKSSRISASTQKAIAVQSKQESALSTTSGNVSIFARTGAPGTLKIFAGNSVSVGQVVASIQEGNAYCALKQLVVSDSNYEPINAVVNRVTTTVEIRLVPLDLGNIEF